MTKLIYVIEDIPGILRLACLRLKQAGFNTLTATSVSSGFDLVADDSASPDLVITDWNLGDGTGLEILQASWRSNQPKSGYIIFTSEPERTEILEAATTFKALVIDKKELLAKEGKTFIETVGKALQD